MAKFNFRLQPLLNVKSHQEDNMKNELGKAIGKLEKEKAILSGLECKEEKLIREFNEKSKKSTVEKLIKFNEYLSFLNSEIKQQKENVNCAARIVDKVREKLIEIVRERKILDNLRDRKHEQFLFEQQKEEQRLNDEIVSFKHKGKDMGE